MPTLAGGIQTALSAILANSAAIEVVNHNVANVNTPGYRRQLASIKTAIPTPVNGEYPGLTPGMQGNGTMLDRILRFSSDLLDGRYRAAVGDMKSWEGRQSITSRLESILTPTTENGLPAHLDSFWASWGNLASDPTNKAYRLEVLSQASDLTSTFRTQAQQLFQLRSDQNTSIADQVGQINTAASQVAALNGEIVRVVALGQQPNDLMDQRDALLDQLAESTGATSYLQKDGTVLVSIAGHALVTNRNTFALQTQNYPAPTPQQTGMIQIVWQDGQVMDPPSGTLQGYLTARDKTILGQIDWLNSAASNLYTQVNNLHVNGYALDGTTTGVPFFDPATLIPGNEAANLNVNPALTLEGIAAAGTINSLGDSAIATQISNLKSAKFMSGGTATLNEYVNTQVTYMAQEGQRVDTNANHASLIVRALSNDRLSESGVSLDEEAANLAKYERAYQAAGRLMNAFDQMMDLIINNMGLVGR